jgi:exonuclease SbcD
VEGKVARWCELANVEAEPVVERLQLLDSGDAEAIAAAVLSRIDLTSDTQSLALAVHGDVSADQPSMLEAAASVSVDAAPTASPSLSWLTDDLFAA